MTRLAPAGIESSPSQPAEVAGRIPPGKRPPKLKLQKQANVTEGQSGAGDSLGLPEPVGKPTTPLPQNKLVSPCL